MREVKIKIPQLFWCLPLILGEANQNIFLQAYDLLGLYYGFGRTFFNPASVKILLPSTLWSFNSIYLRFLLHRSLLFIWPLFSPNHQMFLGQGVFEVEIWGYARSHEKL